MLQLSFFCPIVMFVFQLYILLQNIEQLSVFGSFLICISVKLSFSFATLANTMLNPPFQLLLNPKSPILIHIQYILLVYGIGKFIIFTYDQTANNISHISFFSFKDFILMFNLDYFTSSLDFHFITSSTNYFLYVILFQLIKQSPRCIFPFSFPIHQSHFYFILSHILFHYTIIIPTKSQPYCKT